MESLGPSNNLRTLRLRLRLVTILEEFRLIILLDVLRERVRAVTTLRVEFPLLVIGLTLTQDRGAHGGQTRRRWVCLDAFRRSLVDCSIRRVCMLSHREDLSTRVLDREGAYVHVNLRVERARRRVLIAYQRVRHPNVEPIHCVTLVSSRSELFGPRSVERQRTLTPGLSAPLPPSLVSRRFAHGPTTMTQVAMDTRGLDGRVLYLDLPVYPYGPLDLGRGRLLGPRCQPIAIILSQASTTLRSRLSVYV